MSFKVLCHLNVYKITDAALYGNKTAIIRNIGKT